MPSTLFQHAGDSGLPDHVHYIATHKQLYMISEHEYLHSLTPPAKRSPCAVPVSHGFTTPPRPAQRRPPRPLMATLTYSHDGHSAFGAPPGSPPDLTNSKSSKSSSFHSSTLSDYMGPSDLSHFEDINLDEPIGGPPSDPRAHSTNGRSLSHQNLSHHSVRDLTGTAKPRYPSLKGQVHHFVHAVQRQHAQLNASGKQSRRGLTSPSAPSLTTANLAAPHQKSRSPSPSNPKTCPSAPRSLSRNSSRNMDIAPSPSIISRRQSWQDAKRKTVKEREAECDDEDDDLPEDAVIWNVPISPRPMQDRSPSIGASPFSRIPSETSPPTVASGQNSRAPSSSRRSARIPSRSPSAREQFPPTEMTRQKSGVWQDTYTHLDPDAKKLTEALEDFQTEFEKKQEVQRQQPGLTRSASLDHTEPKAKKAALPPVRRSDPLIDPFQPSAEKQKYLSRTRPSWLPPKNPKEEKKHLKEYQKMLARIEEAERLEAQRAQDEALAREKASRVKAEYWSNHLLPNWATEMTTPDLIASHRKMWWNGIPPRLRGEVWKRAIGNELEVTEATFKVALEKAQRETKGRGQDALGGRYAHIIESTNFVFVDLKMFAPDQPLHTDLVDVLLAYSSYRPDITHVGSNGIQHIAALLILNFPAREAFIVLTNLLNRPLPLSFLVQDDNAMHAAYSTTLHALSKKSPSLALRLETLRVEPREYLAYMFSSLFCARLGIEHAARMMDVYAIEGDKIPPRVAVAIMGMLEGRCMEGDAASVAKILRENSVEMEIEEFVNKVYEAGKSG